jgi:hypothetical protein
MSFAKDESALFPACVIELDVGGHGSRSMQCRSRHGGERAELALR